MSQLVWCGRCHRNVEREEGSGTAWTLDTDYEPIWLPRRAIR